MAADTVDAVDVVVVGAGVAGLAAAAPRRVAEASQRSCSPWITDRPIDLFILRICEINV